VAVAIEEPGDEFAAVPLVIYDKDVRHLQVSISA
jgi:hypothetical protein